MCIIDDNATAGTNTLSQATANTTGSANQPSNNPCIRLWTVFLSFIYLFIYLFIY